jgi:hypothetical protein
MTEAEFLYYYTKIYHSAIVGAVLMVENWTDRNFDKKYAGYIQEYIVIKNGVYDPGKSDDKIKAALTLLKERRLKSSYNALFKFVIDKLEAGGKTLSPEKITSLKERLDKYASLDNINFDYMREIRKIEEEEY